MEHTANRAYSPLLASQRHPQRHRQVNDPVAADVVLFTDCHTIAASDWRLRAIRYTSIAREFSHKVAVYDERDRPWCGLPGIYVSMPARGFVPHWQIAGAYINVLPLDTSVPPDTAMVEPDLLFSFIGAATHRCRRDILRLSAPRSYVQQSGAFLLHQPPPESARLREEFAEVMLRSSFILCPRGHATSSFRLYEALSVGRVPVIVSDAWMPPEGPRWQDFSIRWPEAQVGKLPAYLARREPEAAAMGLRARAAYEEWFARDVVLTRQLDQLETLMGEDGFAAFPRGGCKNRQYFRTLRGVTVARAKRLARRLRGD